MLGADGWLTHGDVAPVDWDTLAARLDNQRDVVAQVAQDAGYAFIDLVPAFQAAAPQTLTYYPTTHIGTTKAQPHRAHRLRILEEHAMHEKAISSGKLTLNGS
ncbi:MAG: hypothetical protein HND48_17995 [Chloroflexi bacterium]|nr:hypothetical protein [Chloroflexota bacterium]